MTALLLTTILVMHDGTDFPRPACAGCLQVPVTAPSAPRGRVDGVVLTGHSTFGRYLGLAPDELARRIARVAPDPEFLVLDTCFGAQAELLLALARAGVSPPVTYAVADWLPPGGLDYGLFLAASFRQEDTPLGCCGPRLRRPVTVVPRAALAELAGVVERTHAAARRCALRVPFVSVLPNLAQVAVPGVSGPVLVEVPASMWPDGCEP